MDMFLVSRIQFSCLTTYQDNTVLLHAMFVPHIMRNSPQIFSIYQFLKLAFVEGYKTFKTTTERKLRSELIEINISCFFGKVGGKGVPSSREG